MNVINTTIPLHAITSTAQILPSVLMTSSEQLTLQLTFQINHNRWRRTAPFVTVHIGQRTVSFSMHRQHQKAALTLALARTEVESPLSFSFRGCKPVGTHASVTVASRPALDDGPIMIVAPHPDDAEIAAGGFYSAYASQTRIVTLSAGELLRKLDRQYIAGLDDDLTAAGRRKGTVRSWNSVATPLLSGVAFEHCPVLGVPDGHGWEIMHDNASIEPILPVNDARRFNTLSLPCDGAESLGRDDIIRDLGYLIEYWQPATILVTDPEYDPHGDHRAAAMALARALQQSHFRPARVLLYANHYRGTHPPGPAFQPAWTPSPELRTPCFHRPTPYLFCLDREAQRHKALLLDAMTDLARRDRPRQIRRKKRKEGFEPSLAPDRDRYFQWAVRSSEYFQMVEPEDFIEGARELPPG